MLIKNAFIATNTGVSSKDVLLENGKIVAISSHIDNADHEVYDATGLFLLPGLIDLNVRFSNSTLNQEHIEKLAQSCLKGGVTTAVVMSDFSPRLESATLLELVKFKVDQAKMHLEMSAPLADEKEDKLHNIATLLNNGAAAILADSHRNSNLLRRGMQYAVMKNKPFFVQCYEPNLDDNGLMNDGMVASKMGLSGISKISETAEVAKVAEMAAFYEADVVLKALSTKRSLEIAHEHKSNHTTKVHTEVSIHHLLKNDHACEGFNTYAKIMPPLREENERLLLVEALKAGLIDVLTSAHSPKSILYKDVAFEDAAFGIGSIEEFLTLAHTFLVKEGIIEFSTLMELCSKNPAAILGLKTKGAIDVGYDADLVLFNPTQSYEITNKNSLYYGETMYGKVHKVLVNGVFVLN